MHDISGEHVRRWPAVCLALVLLAALFALAPGTAYAGWSRPLDTLSDVASDASAPIVVIDGHGTSYAVWTQGASDQGVTQLKTRLRRPGHAWSPTTTTALDLEASAIDAKVAPDGTLVVLWDYVIRGPIADQGLAASTRSPDGSWTAHRFAGYGAAAPELVSDARGDFALSWGSSVSFRPAGGTWGAMEAIPVKGAYNTNSPQVGLDRTGTATFAVVKDLNSCRPCRTVTVERLRNGVWSHPVTSPAIIPDDFLAHLSYSFAESGTGEATLAWCAYGTLKASVRPATGRHWSSSRTLGTCTDPVLGSSAPVVAAAMGPRGVGAVMWQDNDHQALVAAHRPGARWTTKALGTWSTPTYHVHPSYPILEAASDGTMLAGWWQSNSAVMAERTAAGDWRKPVAVPMGDLSVGNGGRATSSWLRYQDGTPDENGYAVVSSYDPGTAAFGSVKAPRKGRAGHRLAYAATVGSWLPATITWHFRDGHTATGRHVHHTFTSPGTYRVTVTITDTSGSTKTLTRPIRVAKRR